MSILRLLSQEWEVEVVHIHRERNFSVDFLTSLAQTVTVGFHRLLHRPQRFLKWLDPDICGVAYERLVGF